MKAPKHLLLTISISSYLILSSCSNKKPEVNDKDKNPFGVSAHTESQLLQPAHWSFTVEQGANGEAILVSTAKLDSGWQLYSQQIPDRRIAMEFVYDSLSSYELVGNTEEGMPGKKYDPYLEMEVLYFEKEAVFRQKIEVRSKTDFRITGTIDYQVCHTQCVTADEEFTFSVKGYSP